MFDKKETVTLSVKGMTCGHCRQHVEDALKAVKGVKSVQVSLEEQKAEVIFAQGKTSREVLAQAIRDAGYAAE